MDTSTSRNSSVADTGNGAPRSEKTWLCVIVALAAGLRLYGLARYSIWFDEAGILYWVRFLDRPLEVFGPEYGSEGRLFTFLTAIWVWAGQNLLGLATGSFAMDYFVRLQPALFGVLSVPLVYAVARRLTGSGPAALLSAALCAVSPFQIYYAQDVRAYAPLLATTLAALWCMERALATNRRRYWVLMTMAMTAGMYTHLFMVWHIVALNLAYVFLLPWHRNVLPPWIAANGAVVVLSIPTLILTLQSSAVYSASAGQWYPYPDARSLVILFKTYFVGYSPSRIVYFGVTVSAGMAVCAGVWLLARARRWDALTMLVIAGAGPVVFALLYALSQPFPYFTQRLFVFCAVPAYVLASFGVVRLPGNRLRWMAGIVILGMTMAGLPDLYAERLHPIWEHRTGVRYKVDSRAAAAHIREHWHEDDRILHRSSYTLYPFHHYMPWDTEQYSGEFTETVIEAVISHYPVPETFDIFQGRPIRMDSAVARAGRLWYVQSWWEPFDMDGIAMAQNRWLDFQAVRQNARFFYGLGAFLYEVLPSPSFRVSIVSDYEERIEPVYQFIDAVKGPGAPWTPVVELDPQAVVPTDWGLRIDDPVAADGGLRYVIENQSARTLVLRHRVVPSAEWIEALRFVPVDGPSFDWHPRYERPDELHPLPPFNDFTMSIGLRQDSLEDAGITATAWIGPGTYDVWMRCMVDALPENEWRAHASVAVAPWADGTSALEPEEVIGVVQPVAPDSASGHQWMHVGRFESGGGWTRFTVRAMNEDRLTQAYFDLGGIVLLPSGVDSVGGPNGFPWDTLEVPPGESRSVMVSGRALPEWSERMDIEVYEPASHEYRRVNRYRERPSSP